MATDDDVAALVASGAIDEAATLLIERRGPEITGYLRGVLRDEGDAADAFSAFCERVWRGLPGFRGEASLRSWCYRIAWNTILSLKKDARRRRQARLRTSMASRLAGRIFATTAAEHERESSALDRLKARLDGAEQTLLTLRVDRQLSWSEIADVFAAEDGARPREAALRKRFERLKDKLASAARDEGLLE
jgi:RNA polymerase sigma-70 factor (ECF subfamily)